MLVVRVELWSAVTGEITEIARATICNVGGTTTLGDYEGATYRGRNAATLEAAMRRGTTVKTGTVTKHRRLDLHVWHLVAKTLEAMGYGARKVSVSTGPDLRAITHSSKVERKEHLPI